MSKKIKKLGYYYSFTVFNNGYMWDFDCEDKNIIYKAGPSDLIESMLPAELSLSGASSPIAGLYSMSAEGTWVLLTIDEDSRKCSIKDFDSVGKLAGYIKENHIGSLSEEEWKNIREDVVSSSQETLQKLLENF